MLLSIVFIIFINLDKIAGNDAKIRIYFYTALLLIFLLFSSMVYIIRLKTPWYNPDFNPPDHYFKGGVLEN